MKTKKSLMRLISLLIIPCLLGACTGYNQVVLPKDQMLPIEEKVVILHRGEDTFYLTDVKIADEQLEATVREVSVSVKFKKDQELHIYVSPTTEIPEPLPARTSIPVAAIERVEVYDVSIGKTIFYNVAWAAPAAAVVVAILLFAASCPFIYTFAGERYEFAGEIYSRATDRPLECHDYLPLPTLRAVGGEYRLKLTNEVREVQYTNLTELMVIEHPVGAEVLVDKYGVPHTLTDLRSPAEAVTLRGEDVGDKVAAAEGSVYMGEVREEADRDVEGIVLTFERPRGATEAKLVFQGKNSFWLDYVYVEFCELFGDAYPDWHEEQKEAPAEELLQQSLDQGVPLSVYVEEAGAWRFVDYYEIVGPMAAKRDVLAFELPAATSEEVKVKLEFGPLFWEIDYVALDYSADQPVQIHNVPLASALDEKGRDVAGLLRADDDLYYVQTEIGEYSVLTFTAPGTTEGMARSTFLHSKGYYEIIINPQGKPDLKLLYSFKEPGRFIEFSQELFLHYYNKVVSREE